MIERLMERAEAIARRAQSEQLQQIAADLRERGIPAAIGSASVTLRGRRLVQQWLADPLLRFAGKGRA